MKVAKSIKCALLLCATLLISSCEEVDPTSSSGTDTSSIPVAPSTPEGVSHVHQYSDPSYTWATDYRTCTATRVCLTDSTHIEQETANATFVILSQPTNDKEGVLSATASFINPVFTPQQVKLVMPIVKTPSRYQVGAQTFADLINPSAYAQHLTEINYEIELVREFGPTDVYVWHTRYDNGKIYDNLYNNGEHVIERYYYFPENYCDPTVNYLDDNYRFYVDVTKDVNDWYQQKMFYRKTVYHDYDLDPYDDSYYYEDIVDYFNWIELPGSSFNQFTFDEESLMYCADSITISTETYKDLKLQFFDQKLVRFEFKYQDNGNYLLWQAKFSNFGGVSVTLPDNFVQFIEEHPVTN